MEVSPLKSIRTPVHRVNPFHGVANENTMEVRLRTTFCFEAAHRLIFFAPILQILRPMGAGFSFFCTNLKYIAPMAQGRSLE